MSRRVAAFSPGTALRQSSAFDHLNDAAGQLQEPADPVNKLSKALSCSWPSASTAPGDESAKVPPEPQFSPLPTSLQQIRQNTTSAVSVFRVVPCHPLLNTCFPAPGRLWTRRFHEMPLVHLSRFLSVKELCWVLRRVCKAWHTALDQECLWKMVYLRRSRPQILGRRSYTPSWKTLCLGGRRLATDALLTLKLQYAVFDLGPERPTKFNPASVNHVLGQSRAPVICCLEMLPHFYWVVLQTAAGFVQTGVLVQDGFIVIRRGHAVALEYLDALRSAGLRAANLRSVVLLLAALQALPAGASAHHVLSHPASSFRSRPFKLVLPLCKRHHEPGMLDTFFGRPRLPAEAVLCRRPPPTRMSGCPRRTPLNDENTPPHEAHAFAVLERLPSGHKGCVRGDPGLAWRFLG